VPLVIDDPSDTWSHDVDAFRDVVDQFEADYGVEIVETGPVRARVLVEMTCGESTLFQNIKLYRDVPRIDVDLTVDYRGEHEFLKIAFPTSVTDVTATYEVPYGFVTREPNGNEEPAQKWADVTGTLEDGSQAGLAVLNDCKYAYDICEGEIRLSVLRTPIYCFHDPAKADLRRRYEYTDQGIQTMTYSLVPHAGNWREGDVVRQAQQVNHPCLVREEPAHKGKLAAIGGFASADQANVIVEVIKRHEDSDGLIARAYETHGQATTATITVAGQSSEALEFRPCEIKTLLVTDETISEVNLLELPQSE